MMSTTGDLRAAALACAAATAAELMTGAQAAVAVRDLATVEKAAATTRMFLALRVAKTDAWRGEGHATAADWLAAQIGVSVWEANRQLGTARKAEDLPKTKEAMKKGKISPDQADAVADAATADPAAEQDLLDLAERDTNKNLKEEAARRKAAATDRETRDRRIHRDRSHRSSIDRDGAWNLHVRGTAADGARYAEAHRPLEEQAFRTHRSDGVRDTYANRSYDAFMALCGIRPLGATDQNPVSKESAAAADSCARCGEPATVAPVPVKRPGGSNVKVIVRVDHTALLRGRTVAGETCDVVGLGPISVTAANAFVAAVIMEGHDVVNVAHLGRGPNAYQRTALENRGTACQNISCNRTVNIEADHRKPYADTPETKLDNLDWLCRGNGGCHDLKTHHGHQLEPGTGRRRLLPPDHPDHPEKRAVLDSDPSPPQRIEQPALC